MELFLKGLVLGFAIAVPVGPIGILCIRKTIQFEGVTLFRKKVTPQALQRINRGAGLLLGFFSRSLSKLDKSNQNASFCTHLITSFYINIFSFMMASLSLMFF